MHLLVDAQALQSPDFRRRGVGRYVRDLIRALTAAPGVRVDLVFNARLPAPDDDDLHLTAQVHWFESRLPWSAPTAGADVSFADWLCALSPDVILLPSLFDEAASIPRFLPSRRPLVVAVVHDLIPLLFHRRYLRSAARRALYAARLSELDRCDLLLAVSEATRRDLMRLLRWPGERVATILGAAEPSRHTDTGPDEAADEAGILQRLAITRPFVLYVGGYEPRKNLTGALAAFAALPVTVREGVQLVLVCALTGAQRRVLERLVHRLRMPADAVVLTGYVEDAELDVLYRRCRLFLFPSYYEGLGLPVLEALRRGAPVVASNRSSIPEFAGPGAHLIDPASPADMAGAIEKTLAVPYEHGAGERRQFADAFEWKTTARLALDAIETGLRVRRESHGSAVPARARTQGQGRPRVAWVSPLPPSPSGIADYSAELLAHLTETFELSLVVSPGAVVHSSLQGFPVLGPNQAIHAHERRPFDLFFYHVGNHERHVYMLDLMRRYSGLTVLHDVAIGGLALKAQETGEWFGSIAATLAAEADGRTSSTDPRQLRELADAVRTGRADHDRIVRDATLNGPVLARSEAVIVHSASSWRRVHEAVDVPVFRVPLGVPAVTVMSQSAARRALDVPSSDFIIATLGEVTTAKRLDRILDAVAMLPADLQARTTFLVVGAAPPSMALDLCGRAMRLGIGRRVRFTGRVSLEELTAFGCAADVCVQLRYPVRGESSAALLRALAAGSACIVSDTGSFSEVPEHVALRVAPDEREVVHLCELLVRLSADPELGRQLRERAVAWMGREHTMKNAARLYAAAITLTIARRRALDSEWIDAASVALSHVTPAVEENADLFRGWAEARRGATEAR